MPTALNRRNHDSLMFRAQSFLARQGCSVSRRTFLPTNLGTALPGTRMEATLVRNISTRVSACGCLGLRVVTQTGRGSAAAKIPGIVLAIQRNWLIPGVLLVEGTAGSDLDKYAHWAKSEVDDHSLVYVGDLAGFERFWNYRLENGCPPAPTKAIPTQFSLLEIQPLD